MNDLTSYLPPYYRKSDTVKNLLAACETELDSVETYIQKQKKQFNILTVDTALFRYEKSMGILPAGTETEEERRGRILSKLRGIGTVNLEMLRDVVAAYVDGVVRIEEDIENYGLKIIFVTFKGTPARISALEASVRALIPAHIELTFIYTYVTWQEVCDEYEAWDVIESAGLTWEGLATQQSNQLQSGDTASIHFSIVDTQTDKAYYTQQGNGNADIIYVDGKAYARPAE